MNHFFRSLIPILLFVLGIHSLSLGQAQQTHTVQSGETLFSISRQYNVPVDSLRAWNDVSSGNLSIGQSIIVSRGAGAQTGDAMTHTVQRQETLFSISKAV
ncbi:MAG: LysM domain-containing protein [Balneolaceae bacterium]|nr:LysM domain-containing protein [Balneolaceae bacterium]